MIVELIHQKPGHFTMKPFYVKSFEFLDSAVGQILPSTQGHIVCEGRVAVVDVPVDEDVVRLQVSVDDVMLVQVFQRKYNLGQVKLKFKSIVEVLIIIM